MFLRCNVRAMPRLQTFLNKKPTVFIPSKDLLPSFTSNLQFQRHKSNSFFAQVSADTIWKGLTSISNQGRRKGGARAGNRKIFKDLNRGQQMGVGMKNFQWPGLNAPILKGNEVIKQKELNYDPQYIENIVKTRDQMDKRGRIKVHPLERGWSGTRSIGKWIGPPDPVAGDPFVGFDTQVLAVKPIFFMKSNYGKSKRIVAMTVTGNRNGLVGYGIAKSKDMRAAINNAKNKAGQRLLQVPTENGTVLHDFYTRFGNSKIFVEKKPPGFGLIAHRCIRSICQVIGITDIHCKVEGNERNYLNLTRAFLLGLVNQKTFQQMANEKRLNVVEFNPQLGNYPIVRAKPSKAPCRKDEEIGPHEITDFSIYIHDGRVKEPTINNPMPYTKKKGWRNYLKSWNYRKSRELVRINLIAKYGRLDSYLTIREKQRLQAKRERFLASNPPEPASEQQIEQ